MHAIPDASLTAYRKVRKKADAIAQQVLEYIAAHPMRTADDVMKHFLPELPCNSVESFMTALKRLETARKRINELIGPNIGDVKRVEVDGVAHYRIREVAE